MERKSQNIVPWRMSCAPMMDWTDRHCRVLHRQLSSCTLLYTEMVTAPALVRGGALHLLEHSPAEHPVALQLGGSDPEELAQAARLGAQAGYDEINLNVGCPSDRVQSGTFGAVLMKDPGLVAECCAAMREAVEVDVTVKCRIGVDDQDPEEVLPEFLARIVAAGVERVTIHARKAWPQGLSYAGGYPWVCRSGDFRPAGPGSHRAGCRAGDVALYRGSSGRGRTSAPGDAPHVGPVRRAAGRAGVAACFVRRGDATRGGPGTGRGSAVAGLWGSGVREVFFEQ